MEITYIFTMISLLIVITFFVFLSIQNYYKRKYDNNGGYHIELNNEIIVDKNTTIYYE